METYPSLSDIVAAMQNPHVCFKSKELVGGTVLKKNRRILQYSGGYTTVFPFLTKEGKKVAVRCWIADIGDAKHRSIKIADYLRTLQSPYFVDFIYLEQALLIQGKFYPVVVMEWVEAKTLKDYINDNIFQSPELLINIANDFKNMVAYLHGAGVAHGDLQHGNLLIKPDGKIVLIDYDSMYIEPLLGMSDTIKGLPGYQHPARALNEKINPKMDFFSESVIYVALLVFAESPDLWAKYYETEDLLFSKDDFSNPADSELFSKLSRSPNPTITKVINKIKEQLTQSDIKQLLPLEELLIDQLAVARDKITSKWSLQPNPPVKTDIIVPNITGIINKM